MVPKVLDVASLEGSIILNSWIAGNNAWISQQPDNGGGEPTSITGYPLFFLILASLIIIMFILKRNKN